MPICVAVARVGTAVKIVGFCFFYAVGTSIEFMGQKICLLEQDFPAESSHPFMLSPAHMRILLIFDHYTIDGLGSLYVCNCMYNI